MTLFESGLLNHVSVIIMKFFCLYAIIVIIYLRMLSSFNYLAFNLAIRIYIRLIGLPIIVSSALNKRVIASFDQPAQRLL